jgi:sugar lactone lactonase YvrE
MMRKIFTILNLLTGFVLSAQNDLISYQWRDHLPYNQAFSVTNRGNTIIAAGNECGFSYDKDQSTYGRLNKVYGYTDIEPVLIKNNPNNNTTVIVYKNSNIDVVKNGVITNVPYLFKKQNTGDKTVNSITFNGPNAYLACSFGIVVLNTETIQFDEEYIIGPNATYLLVYQVALSNTTIYAATKSGLYQASLSSANLQSFTNWNKVTGIPNGPYNAVVYFGGNIITNYSKNIQTGASMQDTLFQYSETISTWSKYTGKPYLHWPLPGSTYVIQKLSVSDDGSKLLSIDQSGFEAMDLSGSRIAHIWDFKVGYFVLYDIITDPTEADIYWAATSSGLLKAKNKPGVDTVEWTKIYTINGPPNNSASAFAIKDDKVIVASSYLGFDMPNNYLFNGVYHFQDNTWGETIEKSNDTIVDINQVVFDNNDKNHYYASSWWNGVIEYVNDKEVAKYNESNTNNVLHFCAVQSGVPLTRTGGMAMDKDNNLWVGMGETQFLLSMKKPDNTWMSFDFTHINSVGSTPNPPPRISHVIVDSSKQVWCVAYNVGLFVYKIDGNLNQPNGNNAKLINNVVNNGGLPSSGIISIAEDKNGDIWVGTDKGIYVFYNPESIFQQTSGWDAQPIYIEQDGKTQLLLQTDEVVCIAVDGANNKWCGTRSSGLYCFSPDGQKQLFHFTLDNSPLFSNNIVDVKVNPKTGEVFIATDKGMLSFQNTIIEGFNDFKTGGVYAYPNPVKPGYDGPILIHGMVNGATVKIIDAAGNFVYQTTSQGGQAQWNGKNFSGTRVANGVYLVLCSTTDASMQVMCKILLQN